VTRDSTGSDSSTPSAGTVPRLHHRDLPRPRGAARRSLPSPCRIRRGTPAARPDGGTARRVRGGRGSPPSVGRLPEPVLCGFGGV